MECDVQNASSAKNLDAEDAEASGHVESIKSNEVTTLPQLIRFSIDDHEKVVHFPAGSAFLKFPAQTVSKPVTLTCKRVKHENCMVKPKKGEIFCSNIIKLEPELIAFDKPVTVLLSHSAAEDGAYADYYDLTVQGFEKEAEDLETERISQHEDIPKEFRQYFSRIQQSLPLAKASIEGTCTLVVASRIRSEEFAVQPNDLCVYATSYGNESELEILFPFGSVETECLLTIQVIPPIDVMDTARANDELICFPVIKVSGRDKPFLRPVEVELCYSSDRVAALEETILPVGESFQFSPRFGVLFHSYNYNDDGIPRWKEEKEISNALIQRCQKNTLKVTFSVRHFCKYCAVFSANLPVSLEDLIIAISHCGDISPSFTAVCLATLVMEISPQKLYTVLAPKSMKSELEELWGSGVEDFKKCKDEEELYFCVPITEKEHLCLRDNHIRFNKDDISSRFNCVDDIEPSYLGKEMRFTKDRCVNNKHFSNDCMGKCVINKRDVNVKQAPLSKELEAPKIWTADASGSVEERTSVPVSSNDACSSKSDHQMSKALELTKKRCKSFEEKVKCFAKKRLYDCNEDGASKCFKVADPATAIHVNIGGGIAISVGLTTSEIALFVGAAIAAVDLVVVEIDQNKHKKNDHTLDNLTKCRAEDLILSIFNEAAKELSRMFEDQLFNLQWDKDVTTMACSAVKLMFKLKDGDQFNRNNLLRKVILEKAGKQNLKTKGNNKNWHVPDVFQKPGLRKVITTLPPLKVVMQYLKKDCDTCDSDTYGYRGQILEMVCNTEVKAHHESDGINGRGEESEHNRDVPSCPCFSDEDTSTSSVTYFIESDIDEQYTLECVLTSQYQPYHCLVRCPYILEIFASNESRPCQSLKNYVGAIYCSDKNRSVKPVYRSHSSKKVRSLSGTDLSGSDFSHANLAECNLEECVLTGCTIMFGELEKANLRRSQFKESLLANCNLKGVDAKSCEWTTSKFYHCRFDGTNLRDCANVVNANEWKFTNLEKAIRGDSPDKNESTRHQLITTNDERTSQKYNKDGRKKRSPQYSDQRHNWGSYQQDDRNRKKISHKQRYESSDHTDSSEEECQSRKKTSPNIHRKSDRYMYIREQRSAYHEERRYKKRCRRERVGSSEDSRHVEPCAKRTSRGDVLMGTRVLVRNLYGPTRERICRKLNAPLLLGGDFKSLAGYIGIPSDEIHLLATQTNPAEALLLQWSANDPAATVAQLRTYLSQIRRSDLVEILDSRPQDVRESDD